MTKTQTGRRTDWLLYGSREGLAMRTRPLFRYYMRRAGS